MRGKSTWEAARCVDKRPIFSMLQPRSIRSGRWRSWTSPPAIGFPVGPTRSPSEGSASSSRRCSPSAGVDLNVVAGEVFGLLGPNGAGKTTTLEMIEGLTPPDAGEIEICGLNWRDNAQQIRSRIGVQLQATSLYNKITPREALDLFGSYYPKRRSHRRVARARAAQGQGRRVPRHALRRPGPAPGPRAGAR